MEDIFKKIKKLVESGTPPTGQVGKGGADTLTGKIKIRKSVKEQQADKAKKSNQFSEAVKKSQEKAKKSAIGRQKVDRGLGSYADKVVKKGAPKGTFKTDEPTSIQQAREQKKDFFFDKKTGKKKAAVTVAQLAAFRKSSGNTKATLRDYLNAQKNKTKKNVSPIVKNEKTKVDKKVVVTPKVDKKVDKKNVSPIILNKPDLSKLVRSTNKTKKTTTFVQPGKAESTKTNRQRRTEELARLAFRSANLMKQGEGRQRALERARKIAFRDLPGAALGGTANTKNGKPIPAGSEGAGLRALKAINPSITSNMGYAKRGGITKRRFGGMAKGGFKMPNKVSKS